jgi:hypothetical protein
MTVRKALRAGIAGLFLWLPGFVLGQAQPVNQDSLLVVEFQHRVDDYMKIHKQALAEIRPLKPTDSPEEIAEHRRRLAHKIREARRHVQQGDIFTPQVSRLFRKIVATSFHAPGAAQIRASLRRADPVPPMRLRVNARYPKGLPLQSTPPSFLTDLPRLPQGLQYRIVGRDLVLLDVDAALIVDYLPQALPPP